MKKSRKQKKLELYVQRYFAAHPEVRLVGIAGSVGKTFAKTATATVLAQKYRVRLFHGNRNTGFSWPLAILGIDYPGDIKGLRAWHRVFKAARRRIKEQASVDIIVHEMSVEHPGDMVSYGTIIRPDIAMITALSQNNNEIFPTTDAAAQEQLAAVNISKEAVINRDDIDGDNAKFVTNANISTFGTSGAAEYRLNESDMSEQGYSGELIVPGWEQPLPLTLKVNDEFSARLVAGAAAIGVRCGLTPQELTAGLQRIAPLPGRMNLLHGVEESTLIDDTHNNNQLGVTNGLRTLYQLPAPHKIAVLGSMKQLGDYSESAHREIGELCDPLQLAWVVIVGGGDAAQRLAPAARARGCQVKVCADALEAGAFVHSVVEHNSAVYFSGSNKEQYVEEALKVVLHSAADEVKLVRQSAAWLKKKDETFARFK